MIYSDAVFLVVQVFYGDGGGGGHIRVAFGGCGDDCGAFAYGGDQTSFAYGCYALIAGGPGDVLVGCAGGAYGGLQSLGGNRLAFDLQGHACGAHGQLADGGLSLDGDSLSVLVCIDGIAQDNIYCSFFDRGQQAVFGDLCLTIDVLDVPDRVDIQAQRFDREFVAELVAELNGDAFDEGVGRRRHVYSDGARRSVSGPDGLGDGQAFHVGCGSGDLDGSVCLIGDDGDESVLVYRCDGFVGAAPDDLLIVCVLLGFVLVDCGQLGRQIRILQVYGEVAGDGHAYCVGYEGGLFSDHFFDGLFDDLQRFLCGLDDHRSGFCNDLCLGEFFLNGFQLYRSFFLFCFEG